MTTYSGRRGQIATRKTKKNATIKKVTRKDGTTQRKHTNADGSIRNSRRNADGTLKSATRKTTAGGTVKSMKRGGEFFGKNLSVCKRETLQLVLPLKKHERQRTKQQEFPLAKHPSADIK